MSWNRRSELKKNHDEYNDLLVFGYSSRIYPNDEQSTYISEERHMVPCIGDSLNRVDRYDCRLLLTSVEDALKDLDESYEECPNESLEEDMCEEERYKDLYIEIKKQKEIEEEEEKQRLMNSKSAIGYDYGTGKAIQENNSDSEDEAFEAPDGIKFPVGLELPPNMKLYHIIERTASFVVAKGAQMEIVIKAKQRNNLEQFGFLDFDHSLYPFYKYLQKLIREKKYIPGERKKKDKKESTPPGPSTSNAIEKPKLSGSLAAIAAAHGSDSDNSDDDSDCELHPSLLNGGLKRAPSPLKPGVYGPTSKPVVEETAPDIKPVLLEDISKRNDVYASLFKNLTDVTRKARGESEEKKKIENENGNEEKIDENNDRIDDPEYREWFELFYHLKCPWIGPKPMVPPTPDLEPIVNSYAEHVARNGCEFEKTLAGRVDLQLHFMDYRSPYYSYYHHRVRMYQWQLSQEYSQFNQNNKVGPAPYSSPSHMRVESVSRGINSPGTNAAPSPLIEPPPMNRHQRRRLLEASRGFGEVIPISEPGVVDPIVKKTSVCENRDGRIDLKPVSFLLNPKVEEPRIATKSAFDDSASTSVTFDPDIGDIVTKQDNETEVRCPNILEGLEPPAPPAIPNNTQLDRKEKARIFMEKLLAEKKLKKMKEDEERNKLEEDALRKVEKVAETMIEGKKVPKNEKDTETETTVIKVSSIDQIINSRISSILSESGFKEDEEQNKEDRRKKKHKRRSRSRSQSSEKRKKTRKDHKRLRSRSIERRRRRSRSRSRERNYRR